MKELLEISQFLSESTLIPKSYMGKPGDIAVAVQWGAEIGLRPLQSLNGISVINGRASIWGDAAIALVQQSNLLENMEETFLNERTTFRCKKPAECVCAKNQWTHPTAPFCENLTTHEDFHDDLTAVCRMFRRGQPTPYVGSFSVRDARRATLWSKPGPWQQYPKRMLQMRARGFPLRDGFADALRGLITVEEAQDIFLPKETTSR
jgi:hypothetical protein